MANPEHLEILKQGVEVWNKWRAENPGAIVDLEGANLTGANLAKANLMRATLFNADLTGANLTEVDFRIADLWRVNLTGANLTKANLLGAFLNGAWLNKATLTKANFGSAVLLGADLTGADLRSANLRGANLTETNLEGANLTNCSIYGVSAWNVNLHETKQSNLIITPPNEPEITVDNLEVAQFVYLLLNNKKIRDVIDTIGEKGVLILGRFTSERKAVLDSIRNELRNMGFVPMMFDFEKPTQRDFTETIKTLAGLSRFIIADITNPKSSPLELQATMPDYMIPFVPIIHEDEQPFAMFRDLKQKYGNWVLDVLQYDSADNLVKVIDKAVVRPALEMSDALLMKKAESISLRHVKDYEENFE